MYSCKSKTTFLCERFSLSLSCLECGKKSVFSSDNLQGFTVDINKYNCTRAVQYSNLYYRELLASTHALSLDEGVDAENSTLIVKAALAVDNCENKIRRKNTRHLQAICIILPFYLFFVLCYYYICETRSEICELV